MRDTLLAGGKVAGIRAASADVSFAPVPYGSIPCETPPVTPLLYGASDGALCKTDSHRQRGEGLDTVPIAVIRARFAPFGKGLLPPGRAHASRTVRFSIRLASIPAPCPKTCLLARAAACARAGVAGRCWFRIPSRGRGFRFPIKLFARSYGDISGLDRHRLRLSRESFK